MNTKLIDISAQLVHETKPDSPDEGAFLLYDGARKEWVPKCVTQNNEDGTFTMPEKLALEKGFI